MKKIFYALSLMVTLSLASCGGHNKQEVVDTDTVVEVNPADETVAETPVVYLTKDSLGCIRIGMPVDEVPEKVPGLYTRRVNDSNTPDALAINFMEDDLTRFVAFDFGEGLIDVINLVGNDVKVKTLKGDIAIGSPMASVLDLPGVTPEWSSYDGSGMWYWTWEGLWFAPRQENLSTSLSQRLYHSAQAPTIKDFEKENVTIGFIGTGLPF